MIKNCFIVAFLGAEILIRSQVGYGQQNDFKGTTESPGAIAAFPWGEAPDEYTVQPGDTLQDICREVVNADLYWPKLWSQNPDIKNPHVIFPGRKLKFFPGEDSEPMFVEVKEDVDIVAMDQNNVAEATFVNEKIPPKLDLGGQVEVDRLSIEVLTNADLSKLDSMEGFFETRGFGNVPAMIPMQLPGRIATEKLPERGQILFGEEGESVLTPARLFVVEIDDDVKVGQVYTAFRKKKYLGATHVDAETYLYQYIATLLIVQKIDDSSDKAFAKVIDIRGLIPAPGDVLSDQWIPYRAVPSNLMGQETARSGYGEIVHFEHEDQRVSASGQYAYLLGKNFEKGKNYPIYQRTVGGEHRLKVVNQSPEAPSYRGHMYIVDTEGDAAVGLISETVNGEVGIGDALGIEPQG